LKNLWNKYEGLIRQIKTEHDLTGAQGGPHDFWHAAMVAQYGLMITEDERTGELVWIAGMCHNVDTLFALSEIQGWHLSGYMNLCGDFVSVKEKKCITVAVENHSKLNDSADDLVAQALKDADRLANLGIIHALRAAQYFPKMACVDSRYVHDDLRIIFKGPNANSFRNPVSVAEHVMATLEWEDMLRLPRAKKMAVALIKERQEFLENIRRQFEETGLYPLPLELAGL